MKLVMMLKQIWTHKDQTSMRLMISPMVLKGGRKQQMQVKNRQQVMKRNRVMLLMTPW